MGIVTSFFLIIYAIETAVILLALTLTAYFCRRRYNPIKFLGLQALWMLILSIGIMFIYIAVFMLFESSLREQLQILLQAPIIGAILGLIAYLLVLPFIGLGWFSSFHRERFYRLFRLPPSRETPAPTTTQRQQTEFKPTPEDSKPPD